MVGAAERVLVMVLAEGEGGASKTVSDPPLVWELGVTGESRSSQTPRTPLGP